MFRPMTERLNDGGFNPLVFSSSASHIADYPAPAALLALLQSPACVLNSAGGVIHMNNAWHTQTPTPEMDGDTNVSWMHWVLTEDQQMALSQFLAILSGRPVNFECRLRHAGDIAHWFMLSLQPLAETDAGSCRWLCLATDIHEIKTRESELMRLASLHTDMLDISVDSIALIALDGTLVHLNKAGCEAQNLTSDSTFGMPWLPLLSEDGREAGQTAFDNAKSGECSRFPGRTSVPGQADRHWDNRLSPVMGTDGTPTAVLCVARDITAEYQAQVALRQSEERLAIAVQVGGLGIWDYDIGADTLKCDANWYRIMDHDPATPLKSISDFEPLLHPEDLGRLVGSKLSAATYITQTSDDAFVFRIIRRDGDIRWIRCAANLVHDGADKPARAVGYVMDITEAWHSEAALRDANRTLEEEKQSLARQSLEDPLTGIPNRRCLDNGLSRILRQYPRPGRKVVMGMVDVDLFKSYNDRYGHVQGDTVLRQIAQALHALARESDLVARYGGEEFAFVLTGTTNPDHVLERFMQAIRELDIDHEDSPFGKLTISVGCLVTELDGRQSPNSLLKACDEALYEAKAQGRNRYVITNSQAHVR